MRKLDFFLSATIGFLDGIFFSLILKNSEVEIPYSWAIPIALALLCLAGMRFAFWIGEKFAVLLQVAKFFLVGTLNTFIDSGFRNILSLIFKISSGLFYSIFKAISFLLATTNSYFWNKYWTFGKKETPKTKEFYRFFIASGIGFLINVGIASFVVNVIGPKFGLTEKIWATVGDIVAAFGAFLWNFLASKFIVFKK
jgi:putative flippase GtrA